MPDGIRCAWASPMSRAIRRAAPDAGVAADLAGKPTRDRIRAPGTYRIGELASRESRV